MNRPFFQKQKGHAQLSASESPPRNRGEYNDQNLKNIKDTSAQSKGSTV